MDLSDFLTTSQSIVSAYALSHTDHNLELIIAKNTYRRDPRSMQVVIDTSDTVTYYAKVRQVKENPYIENNNLVDRDRILIEGNLMVQTYIDIYTQEKIPCIWKENDDELNGFFYPVKYVNNSVATEIKVDKGLGQRVRGYLEIAS